MLKYLSFMVLLALAVSTAFSGIALNPASNVAGEFVASREILLRGTAFANLPAAGQEV